MIRYNNYISIPSSLNKKQICKISTLITEGINVKDRSSEGKKKYLEMVFDELSNILHENSFPDHPRWLLLLPTPRVFVGEGANYTDPLYPDGYVEHVIQLLTDIRAEYYLNQQLKESKKQSRRALYALIVALITLLVTMLTAK